MELFSQRKGIKPAKSIIQADCMDNELRNGLWNALTVCYWSQLRLINGYEPLLSLHTHMNYLFRQLWNNYFKEPIDTLGQALKEIESKVVLHPALKSAFSSLYGYTSDAEGIRHALLDEPNLNFEDAKFMLVSCSSFINYLIAKTSKTGIKL